MAEIKYISIDEAKEIHRLTVKNSGSGSYGSLGLGRLERPQVHFGVVKSTQ